MRCLSALSRRDTLGPGQLGGARRPPAVHTCGPPSVQPSLSCVQTVPASVLAPFHACCNRMPECPPASPLPPSYAPLLPLMPCSRVLCGPHRRAVPTPLAEGAQPRPQEGALDQGGERLPAAAAVRPGCCASWLPRPSRAVTTAAAYCWCALVSALLDQFNHGCTGPHTGWIGLYHPLQEDDAIIRLVAQYGTKRWTAIAEHLPGRIGKQARGRGGVQFIGGAQQNKGHSATRLGAADTSGAQQACQ